MSVDSLEEILEILNRRRKHCRDLLNLSRQQNGVIHLSDYSQLMTILAQKQRVLGRLDEIKRRHPDLGQQWRALRDSGQATVRSDCEMIMAETETILAELLQTEKNGAQQLVERRNATRRQLESISQGVHVNEIYRDSIGGSDHRYLDIDR